MVLSFSTSPTLDQTKNYVAILSALISPLSRGNVSITSSSMKDAPLIDVGWLTNSTDVEVLVESMKRARSLFESDAVKPVLIGEEALRAKTLRRMSRWRSISGSLLPLCTTLAVLVSLAVPGTRILPTRWEVFFLFLVTG